jgi:hypothetical protein
MNYVHVVIIMDCVHPSRTTVKVFQDSTLAQLYALENNGQVFTCRVDASYRFK